MAEWTGRELPDSAVVLSRIPRLFYVLSGLQGRNYPMASTTQALLATADSAHAHWVVFDALGGLAQRYLAPAILQRPQAFCIAQATPNGAAVLLGILPDAASLPDLAPAQRNEQPAFATCARPLGDQPRAAAAPPPQADSANAPPAAAPNSAAGRAP
jgi:hypothetical protein